MMNLDISISQYISDVINGEFTSEEFVSQTMDEIKRRDDTLHAYVHIYDDIINHAKKIDRKIQSGTAGKCLGLPISIKDNICVQNNPVTCGSKILKDYIAPYDATVISRLKNEDATLVGSTNMDEFAMGITTEFSAYGPSKNPWNIDCVPGGSSGGCAVAVSANMCLASLGSDTGGSVRNPASFCSIVGYKPTYGLISRFGLVSYANSIEQIGPMTRTVDDTAFLLEIISGHDSNDNTTIGFESENYLDGIDLGVEGKKFGIINNDSSLKFDKEVESATSEAVSGLENMGAISSDVSIDMLKYSVAAYYTITSTEAASNLARFDNIRYGYDFDSRGFEFNSYISQARKQFGPEVTRRMILGGFVPSAGHAGKYFLKALKVKTALIQETEQIFKDVDFLISPTVPILPFRIGAKIDDPIALFSIDLTTVLANLSGCPAISVPFALSADSLPIGIQIMAPHGKDKSLLCAAKALEKISKVNKS